MKEKVVKAILEKLQSVELGAVIEIGESEIAVVSAMGSAIAYRLPAMITEFRQYKNGSAFGICPTCDSSVVRDYQRCCDVCGQVLKWAIGKMMLREKSNDISWRKKTVK
jgi:hypothetical protein